MAGGKRDANAEARKRSGLRPMVGDYYIDKTPSEAAPRSIETHLRPMLSRPALAGRPLLQPVSDKNQVKPDGPEQNMRPPHGHAHR
jgi:hypothetical protein